MRCAMWHDGTQTFFPPSASRLPSGPVTGTLPLSVDALSAVTSRCRNTPEALPTMLPDLMRVRPATLKNPVVASSAMLGYMGPPSELGIEWKAERFV